MNKKSRIGSDPFRCVAFVSVQSDDEHEYEEEDSAPRIYVRKKE